MRRFARPLSVAAMLVALCAAPAAFATDTVVRIAVLKFGTVAWELDVIETHGLDRKHGIELEVSEIAGKQAADVMLLSGEVDVIVSDWIWVSRERHQGRKLQFIPYSRAVGALMVPESSTVEALADLEGRKIGVAGGPTDKSWIILRALADKRHGMDLAEAAEPVFGAPALLNEMARRGDLDAIVNYWHYLARLEAHGFERLVSIADASEELGLDPDLPMLGYVFFETWAEENPDAIRGLAAASADAKAILKTSDAEWRRLRPLMVQAKTDAAAKALRDGFREGIPEGTEAADLESARAMYALLAELGGRALVGDARELADGVFYRFE